MRLKTNLLLFALTILSICFTPEIGNAVHRNKNIEEIQQHDTHETVVPNKADLEEKLGRKLTFKEKISLTLLKRKVKNDNAAQKKGTSKGGSGKSQIVALLLCIFLGVLGIHRFYLGYTGMGILYLFTAGLFGIGWLIDIILLFIPNGLTPKGNTSYRN